MAKRGCVGLEIQKRVFATTGAFHMSLLMLLWNTMKLPVYKLDINEWDEETGIEFVSLVESPAIQKDFIAFSETPIKFAIQDEDKRIVTGAAMIADLPIYRRDDVRGRLADGDHGPVKDGHRMLRREGDGCCVSGARR